MEGRMEGGERGGGRGSSRSQFGKPAGWGREGTDDGQELDSINTDNDLAILDYLYFPKKAIIVERT
jgi:hypothetical protein